MFGVRSFVCHRAAEFSARDIAQDLPRLLTPSHAAADHSDLPHALTALAALIKYLDVRIFVPLLSALCM